MIQALSPRAVDQVGSSLRFRDLGTICTHDFLKAMSICHGCLLFIILFCVIRHRIVIVIGIFISLQKVRFYRPYLVLESTWSMYEFVLRNTLTLSLLGKYAHA